MPEITFADRLHEAKARSGLTWREIAERCGYDEPRYLLMLAAGRYENPRLDTVHKIAKALGVDASELVGGDSS